MTDPPDEFLAVLLPVLESLVASGKAVLVPCLDHPARTLYATEQHDVRAMQTTLRIVRHPATGAEILAPHDPFELEKRRQAAREAAR